MEPSPLPGRPGWIVDPSWDRRHRTGGCSIAVRISRTIRTGRSPFRLPTPPSRRNPMSQRILQYARLAAVPTAALPLGTRRASLRGRCASAGSAPWSCSCAASPASRGRPAPPRRPARQAQRNPSDDFSSSLDGGKGECSVPDHPVQRRTRGPKSDIRAVIKFRSIRGDARYPLPEADPPAGRPFAKGAALRSKILCSKSVVHELRQRPRPRA